MNKPLLDLLFLGAFALTLAVPSLAQGHYPPPKNVGDSAQLGRGIQRTMALFANSSPQHHNTVRILFYGQSITEQDWWHEVADDLKRRFPDADLQIENRALGGFSSQLLVKTAESDLYPFYPDLMIFHVYGAHNNYEDIIRNTRERTTAEVLIQTDHVTNDADLTEETDPAKLRPDGKIWNSFMNYLWLPTVAKKYGCALLDQRNLWKEYLRDYHVPAASLLKDGVHQNAYGNYLMAELVKPYLVRRKDSPIDPLNCAAVRTVPVGKGLTWQKGRLTLPFEGNRVDVVLKPGPAPAAQVRIDGKKPSEIPELYTFTRALATPGGKWPVILKLGWEKPRLLETWTLDVTKDPANPQRFTFTLTGSKTGPDGEGASDQRFVSKSGRVVIEPADWNVDYSLALPGIKPPPTRFAVHWNVVPLFQDEITAPEKHDRTRETTLTVAQGLTNGKHVLEILGSPVTPVGAVRIYRPSVPSP